MPESCQALETKIFHFTEILICVINPTSPCRHEGRFAVVTKRGAGCDGTQLASGDPSPDETLSSVRRSRVVLAPRPWRLSLRACAGGATVTKKAAHRGELEVSRKTIARGKPGCLGCTCLIRVLSFTTIAHGAAGAASARLSLRPLSERGPTKLQTSGETAP